MGHGLLTAVLLLAYGPLALIVLLYLGALLLKLGGRPELLRQLVERTKAHEPLRRKGDDQH